MAHPDKRSFIRRRLWSVTVLTAALCLHCNDALAGFILDDFNDPVIVKSPESNNQWATTNHVGPLNATRQIRLVWGQGDPDGQLDANISTSSVLTGQVLQLNPRNELSKPIVSLQFQYFFDATDFTEKGINNTLFLDFIRLESNIPPSQFRMAINGWYYSLMPAPRNSEPFTLAIPFDTVFFTRDGLLGQPNFEQVRTIEFSIRVSQWTGGGPDPLNFFMQLDRTRIGRVVPEPDTLFLSTGIGLAIVIGAHQRRMA